MSATHGLIRRDISIIAIDDSRKSIPALLVRVLGAGDSRLSAHLVVYVYVLVRVLVANAGSVVSV